MLGIVLGGVAAALYFVMAFCVQWGYGALSEWRWNGQTIGKRIGRHPHAAAERHAHHADAGGRAQPGANRRHPAGAILHGRACALLDRHGRRLGDLAAGTVVVRQRRSPRPSAVVAPIERYNSFIHDPAVIHASTRISAPERDAMVGLALRRDNLPLAVRYALFASSRSTSRRASASRDPATSPRSASCSI